MGAGRNIVVLYHAGGPVRPSIRHHLHALRHSPHGHRITYVDLADGMPPLLPRARIDVLVLHTTLLAMRWCGWGPDQLRALDWIADHPALKIALPQDEYDHSEVLEEWLARWRVPVVVTAFGAEHRPTLYPRLSGRAHFVRGFTGYIDAGTAARLRGRLLPTAQRPLDLVYRANHLPFWFGKHGQLKHRIATVVGQRAQQRGLRCDISTRPEDTITSDAWFDFLARGKAVLGVESGSGVLDRRGQVKATIQALLAREPGLSFEEVDRHMPAGWDGHAFFALGPRHFEAVFTRTVQVLVEGAYDGVLVPGRHYLPLRRDFADLDAVLDRLGDTDAMQAIADRAYEEIYLGGHYTYAELCRRLDEVILAHRPPPGGAWLPPRLATWLDPRGLAKHFGRPLVRRLRRRRGGNAACV